MLIYRNVFIIIINKIYAVEFMYVMTHNDKLRTNAILYLFSDDVNLKLNVKSTEDQES